MIDALYRLRPRRWLLGWGFRYFLANGLLMALISLRYFQTDGWPTTLPAWGYWGVTLAGHFSLIALAGYLILFALPVILLPKRGVQMAWGIFLAVFLSSVLVLDTFVFAQYRFHISGFVLALVFGGAAGDIFVFSWVEYALVATGFLMIVLVQWFLAMAIAGATRQPLRKGRSLKLGILIVLLYLLGQIGHMWADATYYRPVTMLSRYVPLYYPLTAKRYLADRGWVTLSAERENLLNVTDESHSLRYPLAPITYNTVEKPLNIVLICVDTWRFDMLNAGVTPNIERFAGNSWRFTNHASGGNSTQSGIFSLFYAIPPSYWENVLAENIGPVLISSLAARGYEMGIFSSSKLTSPPFDRTVFRELPDLRLVSSGRSPHERDRDTEQGWYRFLDRAGQTPESPFFGFLFLDGAHGYSYPADAPEPFQPVLKNVNHLALDADFDPLPYLNRYRNALFHVDELVGRVLDDLSRRGILDSTVVLITGDHGEEFNDNGLNYWGHGSNFTRYQVETPLVVHWPGKGAGVVDHRTSHLDIVPTLMAGVLGVDNPPGDYSSGDSLWTPPVHDWILVGSYFNFGVVAPGRITVTYPSGSFEVLDAMNRPNPAGVNTGEIAEVLQEIARFRNRKH